MTHSSVLLHSGRSEQRRRATMLMVMVSIRQAKGALSVSRRVSEYNGVEP